MKQYQPVLNSLYAYRRMVKENFDSALKERDLLGMRKANLILAELSLCHSHYSKVNIEIPQHESERRIGPNPCLQA